MAQQTTSPPACSKPPSGPSRSRIDRPLRVPRDRDRLDPGQRDHVLASARAQGREGHARDREGRPASPARWRSRCSPRPTSTIARREATTRSCCRGRRRAPSRFPSIVDNSTKPFVSKLQPNSQQSVPAPVRAQESHVSPHGARIRRPHDDEVGDDARRVGVHKPRGTPVDRCLGRSWSARSRARSCWRRAAAARTTPSRSRRWCRRRSKSAAAKSYVAVVGAGGHHPVTFTFSAPDRLRAEQGTGKSAVVFVQVAARPATTPIRSTPGNTRRSSRTSRPDRVGAAEHPGRSDHPCDPRFAEGPRHSVRRLVRRCEGATPRRHRRVVPYRRRRAAGVRQQAAGGVVQVRDVRPIRSGAARAGSQGRPRNARLSPRHEAATSS